MRVLVEDETLPVHPHVEVERFRLPLHLHAHLWGSRESVLLIVERFDKSVVRPTIYITEYEVEVSAHSQLHVEER